MLIGGSTADPPSLIGGDGETERCVWWLSRGPQKEVWPEDRDRAGARPPATSQMRKLRLRELK